MTADPRALIAEGRAHDEAMTPAPWYGRSRFVSRVPDNTGMGATLHTNHIANTADREDAAGIAWLRTNLAALLDGYASALDEIERLNGCLRSRSEHARLRAGSYNRERADNVTLRTSIGEQALVIEQQDRYLERLKKFESAVAQGFLDLGAANQQINRLTCDLEASRAINRHFEQERDSWPLAYKQRAAQTDARIADLNTALAAALDGWQYQHNKRCEAEMRDMDDKVIERFAGFRKLLSSTGEPCTTK